MKIFKALAKILGVVVLLALLGIGGALGWFLVVLPPDVPVPDLTVERTPERVAHGEYLATAVFGCMYCHSERDWSFYGGPVIDGTLGKGGQVFDQRQGLSGKVVSPNITPYHLGSWSDGEIYRAITSGLHQDGYAFFPLMPWDAYIWMTTEDVHSIIAYLRSLPTIESEWEARKPSILMRIIANSRVRPAEPWEVNEADPVSRGEYLTIVSGCRFCHSTPTPPRERMMNPNQENTSRFFAGGGVLNGQPNPLHASNISPDPETGIGRWTREQFIARFKFYAGARIPVGPNDRTTEHAWTEYAKMTEQDLGDIYAYLMAQPPKRHAVTP